MIKPDIKTPLLKCINQQWKYKSKCILCGDALGRLFHLDEKKRIRINLYTESPKTKTSVKVYIFLFHREVNSAKYSVVEDDDIQILQQGILHSEAVKRLQKSLNIGWNTCWIDIDIVE